MNKSDLRKIIRTATGHLSEEYILASSKKIEDAVLSSEAFSDSSKIFIYVSMPHEPSTIGIIEAALRCGKEVYVPKCNADNTMQAVRLTSFDELGAGMMGISEPKSVTKTAQAQEIDLAIVPCVCASKSCERLGHGGGYYDRFLQNERMKKYCLCFEKLLRDDIPSDEHDVLMDAVVTEIKKYTACK